MTDGQWYRRLSVQLIALLTLALLPLGLIALYQTNRVAAEADRTAGLALLGLTERAARTEQLLIERAVGAARFLGSIAPDLLDNVETCDANLSRFVDGNPEYSFIGVLPLSGIMNCSSSPEPQDFRDFPGFAESMSAQEPTIVVNQSAPASGQSVFIVSEPFKIDGVFAGFVSISIPHSGLPDTSARLENLGLEELITFNSDGTILTSRSTLDQAAMEMPADTEMVQLSVEESQTFRAKNVQDIERRYGIVTIENSPAAVMAVWRIGEGAMHEMVPSVAPAVFPVLMWFASMGVAMLAVHSLVLRHLNRLRKNMDVFSDTRGTPLNGDEGILIPTEIENLESNFQRMSEEIMRDEAILEDALREKGVLVKEIHHRVKNNLQLISSIMNIQIRSAEHHETRTVLRRVQERVLSLATIHRDLYQSQDGGRVNVGALITEIVEKSAEVLTLDGRDLEVEIDIENVVLYPDQAVPLSLLVSEAVTNAMKYIGEQDAEASSIAVRLTQDDRACILVITNSIGQQIEQESTGLGSQLMNAFAMQLGGEIHVDQTDDNYVLTVSFNALEFEPEARDY